MTWPTAQIHPLTPFNVDILAKPATLKKYDLAGPRYTSYPTAPQFTNNFTQQHWQAAVSKGNKAQKPLSLYFHIPFCDTVCYYCGCNKIITANKAKSTPYLTAIIKEMDLVAAQVDTTRQQAAMSRTAFATAFKELSGWTPMQYLTWWRMQLAWHLLADGEPVAIVADKIGYQSEAAFSRAFKSEFKQTAGEVRRGARN